jgi:hypothetical protein
MTVALTTYATQRRDRYQTLRQQAQHRFSLAEASRESAGTGYHARVAEAAELDRRIAGLRRRLAADGQMPADIRDLGDELRDRLIARAHLTAAIAQAREARHEATTEAELWHARLAALDSLLREASADLADAEAREARHADWTDAGREDEIATLRTLAGQLLDGSFTPPPEAESNPLATLDAARDRIKGDIPEVLRHRARARAALAADRERAYHDQRDAIAVHYRGHRAAAEGDSGLVAQRLAAFDAAEAALRRYALEVPRHYARALELLHSVVDSAPLSDAARDAIAAAALAADSDAVTTEVALHEARRAVEDKELEVALARVAARVDDIDADPEEAPDVQARRAELTALQGELADAQAAHTDAFAAAMDVWEAAVPDASWHGLHRYDRAIDLLTRLRDSDRAPLVTALTDAEGELITALSRDDQNRRLAASLRHSLTLAREKADFLARFGVALSLSALRGDY